MTDKDNIFRLIKNDLKELRQRFKTPISIIMNEETRENLEKEYEHAIYSDSNNLSYIYGIPIVISNLAKKPFLIKYEDDWKRTSRLNEERKKENKKEKIAKFIHEDLWSHWMKYLYSTFIRSTERDNSQSVTPLITMDNYLRWNRQMNTLYEDLPEKEKKSDRELADQLMNLLSNLED